MRYPIWEGNISAETWMNLLSFLKIWGRRIPGRESDMVPEAEISMAVVKETEVWLKQYLWTERSRKPGIHLCPWDFPLENLTHCLASTCWLRILTCRSCIYTKTSILRSLFLYCNRSWRKPVFIVTTVWPCFSF